MEVHSSFFVDFNCKTPIAYLPIPQQYKSRILQRAILGRENKGDICYPIHYDINRLSVKTMRDDRPAYWNDLSPSQARVLHHLLDRLPRWIPHKVLNTMNDANSFEDFLKNHMPYTESTGEAIAHFSRKTRFSTILHNGAHQYHFVLTWRQPHANRPM
ncbi:MAG TPA: hypothetical protein VGT41_03280 [Candidatus Babeliales bacterium]|nr:hypothetical protein [Candidatus Babeliales bacterium]